MSNTLQAVHLLEDKLKVLLSNYEFLKKENEVLLQDNSKLQILLQEKEQMVLGQQQEIKSLTIAKTIKGSTESIRDTKQKINALVREIDKCIVQLNK